MVGTILFLLAVVAFYFCIFYFGSKFDPYEEKKKSVSYQKQDEFINMMNRYNPPSKPKPVPKVITKTKILWRHSNCVILRDVINVKRVLPNGYVPGYGFIKFKDKTSAKRAKDQVISEFGYRIDFAEASFIHDNENTLVFKLKDMGFKNKRDWEDDL